MLKRLVLCLDGTWNTADSREITNIVRLRDFIEPMVTAPSGLEEQRVYYHNGVGTGLSRRDRMVAGATGSGLDHNVRSAYKFLSQYYQEGLEVYIFGFSRGAFTARSLVGYIAASGLLKPEHCSPENERRAWNFYVTSPDDRYPHEGKALAGLSHPNVRIRLLGVFDTVGALGVPLGMYRNWNAKHYEFHNVTLGMNIDYAFHALAIDEKRGPFQASLWQYPNHKQFKHVEQVWFPGVHANIGGGYENRGISDRTLFWMMSRIERNAVGLRFLANWKATLSPDISGTLYESRTVVYTWSRLQPMVRVINQSRPTMSWMNRLCALPPNAIPLGEMLDYSALYRWKDSEDSNVAYRPINLEAALDRTFAPENPYPIPIVDEDGEPLDWIKNDEHRTKLYDVLPSKYQKLAEQTVDKFSKVTDTSDFSVPYTQPRIPVSPR